MNEFNNQDALDAHLDLMHILDSTSTPVYLFDKFVVWLNKNVVYNNIFFASLPSKCKMNNREQALHLIKQRTNMKQINCLHSVLMDDSLMMEENLLMENSSDS